MNDSLDVDKFLRLFWNIRNLFFYQHDKLIFLKLSSILMVKHVLKIYVLIQ